MGSNVFWAVVFGFLAGVFVRSFVPLGWSFVVQLFVFALITFVFILFDHSKSHALLLIAITLFSGALGIARMRTAVLTGDPNLSRLVGKSIVLEGVVFREPDARATATLVSINVSKLFMASSTVPVHAGVLANLPAHAQIAYGDHVIIAGKLQLPQPFDIGDGRAFDYPSYLASQGIGYQLQYGQVKRVEGNSGNVVQAFAIGAKQKFLHGLNTVIPDPEAALAGGITVGDKRSIGPELSQDFQRDSLVHMIVLSGYNITVVLNTVARILAPLSRGFQFCGSIIVVIFFILVSGGASSAVRAGLMALIATFARATHRVYLGERALAFVTLTMVIWNPWTLCFDPSFQLSALATLGLILFTPPFAALFARVPEHFGVREILSSTCATQTAVLPLLLYQNGTLSLVALPANMLALLPVPFAMLLSLIAAISGMLFGSLAVPFALPAYALLWYIITIAHLFASLPGAAVVIPAFSVWWALIAYAGLFGALFAWKKKQRRISEDQPLRSFDQEGREKVVT